MNPPGSSRELLIIEAIGDVAKLLDRVDALAATLDAARSQAEHANAEMQAQAVVFEGRISLLTESAKSHVVTQIVRKTEELTRGAVEAQTRALKVQAQELFEAELRDALQRIAQFIDARVTQRSLTRQWWVSAAAIATAMVATFALTVLVLSR